MFKYKGDYAFDTKTDENGQIGVKEEFKSILRGDERTLNMVVCLDIKGRLTKPAYYNRLQGFKPLSEIVHDYDSALLFDRSNRAEYSMLSNIVLIADVIIKVDVNTRVVDLFRSKINLYMPKGYADVATSKGTKSCLLCSRVVDHESKLETTIDPQLYRGYLQTLINQINGKKIDDRIDLTLLRLND